MSSVKIVAIFAENRIGQMARITKIIADAGVNIRWVTIATSETFGVLKVLVDKCDLACQSLKQHGFTVSLVEVLAVEVEDKPGGLYAVADCLTRNNVNIENSSGFISGKRAVLLFEVKDIAQAWQALEKNKFRLLSQEEILSL
jgi:hypothetical protein